jgi:diaminohydroxyphosphoribosylaminopyrimidine deaminase/5-amino-6-(5-phosphoribosylamino)uracil reductase
MADFTLAEHQFMLQALALAKRAYYSTSPNPRVGCVIVNQQKIVGQGFHLKAGEAHAEVNAIKQAGSLCLGATAYVTLEPCSHFGRTPPCAQALIESGISQVIIAMVDPNPKVAGKGIKILEKAGIDVKVGLLEDDAQALNLGFIKLMTSGLPYVRCKLAASLDGKTAMASGESQWITSKAARTDVQRLRAQSCAVISGADSILTDNARMTVRWPELHNLVAADDIQSRQPVRVVIDTKNRLTPELAFFSEDSSVILIRHSIDKNHVWPHFVEQICLPFKANSLHIELTALLKLLAQRGLNDVLIESGLRLAGAFFEQNLVDELILYQAAKLMGASGKSLVAMPSITQLTQAKHFTFEDVTMVGPDIRIVASLNKAKLN